MCSMCIVKLLLHTSYNWDLGGDHKMLAFSLNQQKDTQSSHAFSDEIAELMISISQEAGTTKKSTNSWCTQCD